MKTRLALIGNMNNNQFALARHLRDRGYAVTLFFSDRSPHFHPSADSFDPADLELVRAVNWLDRGFYYANLQEVRRDLQGFSFYMGQGEEAAVAQRAGFPLQIYFPYGSDVYKYAYLPPEFHWTQRWAARLFPKPQRLPYSLMREGTMAKFLRQVIREAPFLMADYTNEDFEARLKGLDYQGERIFMPLPFLYPNAYDPSDRYDQLPLDLRQRIQQVRDGVDWVVLYHGRQEWKTYHNAFTAKNTHYLIQGFSQFLKAHPRAKARLVMLDYGSDVDASRALIAELGIQESVLWLGKMERRALICLIDQVDLGAGEFGRSYLSFGTIMEAMIRGRAVIHHREDALYRPYGDLYPMIHARSAEEIAQGLEFAYKNRERVQDMGQQAKRWVEEKFVRRPLDEIEARIQEWIARDQENQ